MQNKTLKILGIIFGILVLTAVVPAVYPLVSSRVSRPQPKIQLLPGYEPSSINTLVIKRGIDQVYFTRTESGWNVNDKVAKSEDVSRLLEAFKGINVVELASTNPGNQSRMGVDEFNGYVIHLKNATSEWKLVVGISNGANSYFIRKADATEVYIAEGNLKGELSTTESSWVAQN
jgi:hypothetical protein